MHEFLWLHISVHPFWFVVGLLVCAVVIHFAPASGVLLLAVYLYAVTVWAPLFDWLPQLFWLAVVMGLAGVLLGVLAGGAGRGLALIGAFVALLVVLILMHGSLFGVVPAVTDGSGDPAQVSNIQNDLNEERDNRIFSDNDVRRDFDRLTVKFHRQHRQLVSLENQVDSLGGRIWRVRRDWQQHEQLEHPHQQFVGK